MIPITFTISRKVSLAFLILFMLMSIIIVIIIQGNHVILRNIENAKKETQKLEYSVNLRLSFVSLIMSVNDYILKDLVDYRYKFAQQHLQIILYQFFLLKIFHLFFLLLLRQ
jgi:hypothetical protein